MVPMSEQAPGWYPDPSGENRQRFWDGDGWTEYYQPLAPQQSEPHGSQTAAEDYPYLTQAHSTPTPHIPPPQGWQPADHTWTTPSTSGQASNWQAPAPAAWGQPAATSWGEHGVPQPDHGNGSTQVYRSGSQGGRRGWGGLIAVVAICVLVLGMLVAGGILAFRDSGEARDTAETTTVTEAIDPTTVTSGTVPRDGEWVGTLTIEAGGNYLVDARSTNDGDLQMALRSAGGGTVAYSDDRGRLIRMGAEHLDPLVVAALEPGEYEVALTDYLGDATDFEVTITEVTDRIDLGERVTVDLDTDEGYLAVLEITETTTVTIHAEHQNGADPTLTVRSLDRDAGWSDDDSGSDWNPLLEDLELEPGAYAVMVAEYFGEPLTASVQIDVD